MEGGHLRNILSLLQSSFEVGSFTVSALCRAYYSLAFKYVTLSDTKPNIVYKTVFLKVLQLDWGTACAFQIISNNWIPKNV